ncbi:RAB3GAP1 [Bugula neritina]|uniref:RAB3GAP1 n=1 Tax=Bugula neritina TaxID=10212 RepID=A0A7J7KMY7_BUGNE|nr:RAB3GAP1 [Bugula neritina]
MCVYILINCLFVAQLEEVIHEWKLTTNSRYSYTKDLDINTAKWQELTDEITFANFPFGITFYCIKGEDSQSTSENMNTPTLQISSELSSSKEGLWAPALKELHHNKQEFPSKVHCLCRWYGLASFVVIYPKSYSISDESRINMLVSAITVASQTTSCVVPLFVQSLEPSRKFYTGCLWSPNSTTSFQMVHLNRVPEKFKNLCGLLDVFKQKLNMQRDIQTKAVVSVRLTCVLQDLERNVWSWPHEQAGFLEDGAKSTVLSLTGANCLPFGTYEDSIENLCLYAMWLNMSEDVLSDNSANSDLEPLSAPIWTTQVTMSKEVQGLLTQCLLKFANLCDSKESFGQAVGTKDEKNDNELADALEKLTDPHTQYNLPSLSRVSRVVSNTRSRLSSHPQTDSPIPLDLLNKILLVIFS